MVNEQQEKETGIYKESFVFTDEVVRPDTIWRNDSTDTATLRLLTHEMRPGKRGKKMGPGFKNDEPIGKHTVFMTVVIRPGETVELPSEYDQAIRTLDPRTGQIVAGLCPWLTKVGESNSPPVPDIFDYKAALLEEEAQKIIKTVKKEQEMRNALVALDEKRARKESSVQAAKDLVKAAEEDKKSSEDASSSAPLRRGRGRPKAVAKE